MNETVVSVVLVFAYLVAHDQFGWDPIGALIRAATVKSPIKITMADRVVVALAGVLPAAWVAGYDHRRIMREHRRCLDEIKRAER